jgi:hypothetical protein
MHRGRYRDGRSGYSDMGSGMDHLFLLASMGFIALAVCFVLWLVYV